MNFFEKFLKKRGGAEMSKGHKDISEFPTREERIAAIKTKISRLNKRINELRESEENPIKLAELQEAATLQKLNLKKMES